MARVTLIAVVYEPDTVSTAVIVAGLARQLTALGHDVSVLTSVPHYNASAKVRADPRYRTGRFRPFTVAEEGGIHVVRCYVPQRKGPTLRRAFQLGVLHFTLGVAALRHFRETDVAIVVSPPLTLAFAAFALKAVSGTKVIYNVQELWPDVPRELGIITNPVLIWLLGRLERAIYRRADAVTPIGDGFGEVVRRRGARHERVTVIPNFVDAAWISPRRKRNMLSEEWALADQPVVLYAGNVGLTQDFQLLLEGAAKLPDVAFVIVGSGAGLPDLRRRIGELALGNVQLHPYQPPERVADLYGMADVVAVPLRPGHARTTTPSKIFSAMAAGKPVLACADADTDVARVLAVNSAGITVPPGDLNAFVDAIERLVNGRAEEFERSAALEAATRHSPGACAAAYDRLLRRVTAPKADS